jgi:hypothetical protein
VKKTSRVHALDAQILNPAHARLLRICELAEIHTRSKYPAGSFKEDIGGFSPNLFADEWVVGAVHINTNGGLLVGGANDEEARLIGRWGLERVGYATRYDVASRIGSEPEALDDP